MYTVDYINNQLEKIHQHNQYIQLQINQLNKNGCNEISSAMKKQIDYLIEEIINLLSEYNCRNITINLYDEMLEILSSWRRYFNQIHEAIIIPPIPPLMSLTPTSIKRKIHQTTAIGKVIRLSSNKTIKVEVLYTHKHPLYGKTIRNRKIYTVHDENNAAQISDIVLIAGCRRISKTKSHRLVRIINTQKKNTFEQNIVMSGVCA